MSLRDAIAAGLIVIAGGQLAQAEPVIQCDGTTYLGCSNIGDTNVFLDNPNDYGSINL